MSQSLHSTFIGTEFGELTTVSGYKTFKNLLKHTWVPFFIGFGRLNSLQQEAIPHILNGKNAIISSPAATGKTEAAFAPIVERVCLSEKRAGNGLRILYISPTRALVNDIYLRMKGPLSMCGFKSAIRTGERPEYSAKDPEDVLFTTPESLDSMLCRYPKIWEGLKAVILDEIHLIDNSYRGDQLRVLLQRIRLGYSLSSLQYAALSATIYNPKETASRYFQDPFSIKMGEPRSLSMHLFPNLRELVSFLRQKRLHKVIFFANSRRDCERLGTELKEVWPPNRIAIHHGSLSKRIREATESALREWRWGICIATTTLEIGIDVGDFDAVLCYHPPLTPSSFQQRIGRGCRRKNEINAIGLFSNEEERECFEIYAEMARAGEIEPTDYEPDISVVVQQIFSYLFSHTRGEEKSAITEILNPIVDLYTFDAIMNYLIEKNYVTFTRQRYYATEKLMNLAEKGIIHSNIPTFREYRIVDKESGILIGEIGMQAMPGTIFALGGRIWEVVSIKGMNLYSKRISQKPKIDHFRKRRQTGAFTYLLPEFLREEQPKE